MTVMELVGCALVAFSPALAMFIFTVARHPLKIIILTCSSFFWLLSLLLSAVVWYAIVPLRQHLVFSMIVSVMFQEGVRIGFYYLLKKAESGLQKIAMAEDEPSATGAANAGAQEVAAAYSTTTSVMSVSAEAEAEPAPSRPPARNQSATAADQVSLTSRLTAKRVLNLRSLSYVCGLGFGFMSGAFAMVNLLADTSGPGSVGLGGEHEAFLMVSASLALLFSCLNVCWTVLTFVCLEDRKFYVLVAVCGSHMLCSLLTLLNSSVNPLMSLAPILASLTCLLGCLALSLALLGASIPGFLLSLISPMWICSCFHQRKRQV